MLNPCSRKGIPLVFILLMSFCLAKPMQAEPTETSYKKITKQFFWPNKKYPWYFSKQNMAGWMSDEDSIALFKKAAEAWNGCGVDISYQGLTDAPPARKDFVNVIGWAKLPPAIRGLSFRNSAHDSEALLEVDVIFNIDNRDIFKDKDLLFKVVLHEMGHALGLNHAPTCNEVMSSAAECGRNIANPPPLNPTAKDLEQCALRYSP